MTNTSQHNARSQVSVAKGKLETVSRFPELFSDVFSHRVINVEHVQAVACTTALTNFHTINSLKSWEEQVKLVVVLTWSILGADPVRSGNPPTSADLRAPRVGVGGCRSPLLSGSGRSYPTDDVTVCVSLVKCRGKSVTVTDVFSFLLRYRKRVSYMIFPITCGAIWSGFKKGHIFFLWVLVSPQEWTLRIVGSYFIRKVGPWDFRF